MRSLEAQGVPSKQAEAITSAITEVLNDSLENVAHTFVSKGQMEKVRLMRSLVYRFFFKSLTMCGYLANIVFVFWIKHPVIHS